jgi:NADPH-dependent curcumin reductase CurA
MAENRQVLIDSLPEDKLQESNYRLDTAVAPEPGAGEILCRTLAVTVGAGTRAGMQGSASYAGAPKTNIVMNGSGVARVEQSNDAGFVPGDLVVCGTGWQDYSVHQAKALRKVSDDIDPAHHLGALGTNGLTAYFGLIDVGQPTSGNTVLVSAAAGSVGHLVGQIAKIKGCSTVGITSTEEKCHLLTDKIGYDGAVSYRSPDFRAELKAACPNGVDIYFDNTGGDILGMSRRRMNEHGRIVCCGVVSQYDTSNPAGAPTGIPGLLVNKRIRMEGFLVFDYTRQYEQARADIKDWITSGQLTPLNDEIDGLEKAPAAFVDLLAGGNVGTRIIRVAS